MSVIDRPAAIDAVIKRDANCGIDSAEVLRILPSAEKKGRWYLEHYVWLCDQCGQNPTKGMGYVQGRDELYNYCPHCGAKMEGAKE